MELPREVIELIHGHFGTVRIDDVETLRDGGTLHIMLAPSEIDKRLYMDKDKGYFFTDYETKEPLPKHFQKALRIIFYNYIVRCEAALYKLSKMSKKNFQYIHNNG